MGTGGVGWEEDLEEDFSGEIVGAIGWTRQHCIANGFNSVGFESTPQKQEIAAIMLHRICPPTVPDTAIIGLDLPRQARLLALIVQSCSGAAGARFDCSDN